MDLQYKILFLINLLEGAAEKASKAPNIHFKVKNTLEHQILKLQITCNDEEVLAKEIKGKDLSEIYFKLKSLVETIVAGELFYKKNSNNTGNIKMTARQW